MIIEEITLTAFQQHTRVVGCAKTKRAICIDPGEASEDIVSAIEKHGFELQASPARTLTWITSAELWR